LRNEKRRICWPAAGRFDPPHLSHAQSLSRAHESLLECLEPRTWSSAAKVQHQRNCVAPAVHLHLQLFFSSGISRWPRGPLAAHVPRRLRVVEVCEELGNGEEDRRSRAVRRCKQRLYIQYT